MIPLWMACISFFIPVAMAVMGYRILIKKIGTLKNEVQQIKERPLRLENLEVDKISLPGFEVKVINGELSLTPKK